MSKTPEYQKKASREYVQRMIKAGYIRFFRWMKPSTKEAVEELIRELEGE